MKNYTRLSDNYAGKIAYYAVMVSNAVDALDMDKIKFYTTKLDYFVTRAAASAASVACSAALDNEWANESI